MKVVQPDGKTTKSGGQVVKNVSGYDMARLHIGGLGTLGIIAEISLRLTPLPPDQKTVLAAFDTGRGCLAAGLSVFHSDVVPLALTSFDSHASERAKLTNLAGGHFLAVRLGGRPRTLERQADDCHSICRESGAVTAETLGKAKADALWRGIADFGWDEATAPKVAGRASLLPTKAIEFAGAAEQRDRVSGLRLAVIVHPATGSVHMSWFDDEDAVPDEAAGDMLDRARHAAHDAGGRFVIERCPIEVKARFDVWDEIGESLATMRRMKEQFDPKGMLNPGRYAGRI
jgi:glycolate oxidase FAD binding subunit